MDEVPKKKIVSVNFSLQSFGFLDAWWWDTLVVPKLH